MGGLERFLPKFFRVGPGIGFQFLQEGERSDRAQFRQFFDRGHADRFLFVGDLGERHGLVQGPADFLVRFLLEPGLEERKVFDILVLAQFGDGIAAHPGIGIGQRHEIEAGLDGLAKPGAGIDGRQLGAGEEERAGLGVLDEFTIRQPDGFGPAFPVALRVEEKRNPEVVGFVKIEPTLAPGAQGLSDERVIRIGELFDELDLPRLILGQDGLDEDAPMVRRGRDGDHAGQPDQ
jgi:hypothetical protein